jgi:hypothetical protein
LLSLTKYLSLIAYSLIFIRGSMIAVPLGCFLPVRAFAVDGSPEWMFACFACVGVIMTIFNFKLRPKGLWVAFQLFLFLLLLSPLIWMRMNFSISWFDSSFTLIPFFVFVLSFMIYSLLLWRRLKYNCIAS